MLTYSRDDFSIALQSKNRQNKEKNFQQYVCPNWGNWSCILPLSLVVSIPTNKAAYINKGVWTACFTILPYTVLYCLWERPMTWLSLVLISWSITATRFVNLSPQNEPKISSHDHQSAPIRGVCYDSNSNMYTVHIKVTI